MLFFSEEASVVTITLSVGKTVEIQIQKDAKKKKLLKKQMGYLIMLFLSRSKVCGIRNCSVSASFRTEEFKSLNEAVLNCILAYKQFKQIFIRSFALVPSRNVWVVSMLLLRISK